MIRFVGEGNIGRDAPKLEYANVRGEQKPVLTFSARFDVRKRQEDGDYQDTKGFWARVSFWGGRAEHYESLLQPGARVVVSGVMEMDRYTAKSGVREGQEIDTVEITAESIGLVLLGVSHVEYSKSRTVETEEEAS